MNFLKNFQKSAKISTADEYRTRIVKGFECSPMDHPYLVSIGTTRKPHFCGGSLLSNNLVLTAGHCCEEEGYFRIFTGLTRVRSLAQSAYVAEIYRHPNYTREPLSTDLCVLKLSSEILENEYTKYATIINSSLWDEWIAGQNCRAAVAMGFGYQGVKYENGTPKDRNAPFNPIMQCVQLSIIPSDVCQLAIDDTMFCAIDPLSEGRDPCQGDSGGPLICQDVQIGIISAGFGCGLEGFASIYTRVDLFSEYLKDLVVTKSGSTSLSIITYVSLSFIIMLTVL
ncbi:Trypsin, partial [Oryctes borbonicus]